MSDPDLIKLYTERLLALAADIPLTDPIDAPQARASKRADVRIGSDGLARSGTRPRVAICPRCAGLRLAKPRPLCWADW